MPDPTLETVSEISELRNRVTAQRQQRARIGFVPTMGALHAGHTSLIEAAGADCDFVVVSIYVNPTQFGPDEDFERYPRVLEQDLAKCAAAGANLVWTPDTSIMYPDGYSTDVTVKALSRILEGATRTNHFQGVTTIVTKLLLSCLPDIAYFGAKDFQQQAIIRRMCLDLNIPVEIKTCPIIRDSDGLALSSRNAYLSKEEREAGLSLSRALRLAEERIAAGETDLASIKSAMQQLLKSTPLLKLDYATIADPTTLEDISSVQSEMVALIAAWVGATRLIDNCRLNPAAAEKS
ncbi:pantoate--beta-alanine ligase [Gimesia sp.]|uniref:pantoate--beta-alanine ligase n=1 Tax=Gimesia sp. TaxID=2024833 RepID=UPI000C4E5E20|nr:pantoate--beta-alanine ligase [Gimesia sp.]MAX39280.1 pantoate--beta-alanine ligase [Gimesia sp.]HAH43273.1 pantoate--beta-alanine ligase [Planctomycetaceae bacterium]|tara:strand:+ start:15735 stop:16613 length:879 start_codon:yes stop_codon:yes gene_type:complete